MLTVSWYVGNHATSSSHTLVDYAATSLKLKPNADTKKQFALQPVGCYCV
jgi:hypothetical protein